MIRHISHRHDSDDEVSLGMMSRARHGVGPHLAGSIGPVSRWSAHPVPTPAGHPRTGSTVFASRPHTNQRATIGIACASRDRCGLILSRSALFRSIYPRCYFICRCFLLPFRVPYEGNFTRQLAWTRADGLTHFRHPVLVVFLQDVTFPAVVLNLNT